MCFSSTASFGVSALLLVGGVASLKQVKSSSQVPFASIPFIFSIQQFCEGFVWRSIDHEVPEHIGTDFAYAFLVFAQVIWPIWVPFSIILLEKNKTRKKILHSIFFLATLLSGYLLYCLLFHPVKTSAVNHHICYELGGMLHKSYITGIAYFIVTIAPPFLSGLRKMRVIGVFSFLSFVVAFFFFSEAIISVWCFFAAAISVGVFLVLKQVSSKQLKDQLIIGS